MEIVDETIVSSAAASPLNSGELQTLINVLGSVDGRLPIPANHLVYPRLGLTLQSGIEECVSLALRLVRMLSAEPSNREACLQVVLDAGAALEVFLASHTQLNSRVDGPDDELNRDMMGLLIHVSNYALTGKDALEFVRGNARQCLQTVCSLLRHSIFTQPPIAQLIEQRPMHWMDNVKTIVNITRVVYELSAYETYLFCVSGDGAEDTDRPMAELSKQFEDYIGGLSNFAASSPLIDLIAVILDGWFEFVEGSSSMDAVHLAPHFEAALSNTLLFVCNLLTTTTSFSAQFKQHLSLKTVLIQNVVLPSLLFELDILERRAFSPDNAVRHMRVLMLIIKVVSLVSNKIRVFRPWLRKFPYLGSRMMRNETMLESNHKLEYAALVTRLVINAELSDSIAALLDFHATLTEVEKHRLAVRLSNPREIMYPVNVFSSVYASLRPLFEQRQEWMCAAPAPHMPSAQTSWNVGERRVLRARQGGRYSRRSVNLYRTRTRHARRRQNLVRRSTVERRRVRTAADNDSDDEVMADDEMARSGSASEEEEGCDAIRHPGSSSVMLEPILVQVREMPSAVRLQETLSAAAPCEEGGHPMPASTPGAAEDAPIPVVSVKPALHTGATLAVPPPHSSLGVASESHPNIGDDDESEGDGDATVAARDPQAPEPSPQGPFDLTRWRKPPPPGIPSNYLCALSQQLIRVPVISPSGDVFDKAAILDFLQVHPRTCPLTGGELYPTDLVVDAQFRRELDAVRLNYAL